MRFLIGLAVAALGTVALAADAKYTLSGENTKVEFTGTKKAGKHDGGFKTLSGTVTVPGDDFSKATIDVTIQTDSLYSDDMKLTGHLKGADFFDVKTNKTATFKSTKIETGKDGYQITGDLTLNGKTKSISFAAPKASAKDTLTLTSKFNIDRTDFGMTYGAGMIDNAVQIRVDVNAKK